MQNQNNSPKKNGENRRGFMKKGAAATAATALVSPFGSPVYGDTKAPSTGRVLGANDRIRVAHIGVGGQGQAHCNIVSQNAAANNVEQVAVCDVSKSRIDQARAKIQNNIPGAKLTGYEDHRELLEKEDVDAIICATVDHWHTPISCDAMESGRDVYVEKPMTRYLGEAFKIHDTCKETGRLVQVGSQGCSAAKYHKAAELIQDGAIGPLVLGQTSYMRNNPKGEWNYPIREWASKSDMNWDRWIEPVHKKIEFSPDHYFRWRKYYPYCAGLLGDLLPHLLHPFMLATGKPEFPSRVVSLGSKTWRTDQNTPGTPERDVDESVQLIAEFPSGFNLMCASATVNETGMQEMIRGHHGTIYMGGLGGTDLKLRPERRFADEIDPEDFNNLQPGEHIGHHEKNFFDCIRSRKEPNAGIDLAVRVQTVISLAEMSDRLNVMCMFDEKTRTITTADGKKLKPLTYGSMDLS